MTNEYERLVAHSSSGQLDDARIWQAAVHERRHAVSTRTPHTPEENPTGIYRREFTVPGNWHGRRVGFAFWRMRRRAVRLRHRQPIGISKDRARPPEFDVTNVVRPGETNELVAVVVQWSDASFIETRTIGGKPGFTAKYICTRRTRRTFKIFSRVAISRTIYATACCAVTCKIGFTGETHADCAVEAQLFDSRQARGFQTAVDRRVRRPDTTAYPGRVRAAGARAETLVGGSAESIHARRDAQDTARTREHRMHIGFARSKFAIGSCSSTASA